jgi:predicted dehydrogenase
MAKVAAKKKVVTQMGNQGHSNDGTRRVVELVQSGAIGDVKEVHCWTDRPIWPQGIERPPFESPTPSSLHWDLWLGPAPERPYNAAYHPFNWRGWWDFGTGALGDMACHVMDTAFWALELGAPVSVEAEGEPRSAETGPKWMIIKYRFPQRGNLPPVNLTWYDGGKKPSSDLIEGEVVPDNGTILVGEKGKILLPDPYGSTFVLLPKERFARFTPPSRSIPNSIGHHEEWIMACKEGSRGAQSPGSHFEYASALTETVLLGNIAFRANEKITWDSEHLKARRSRHADELIHRDYRRGWDL